MFKNLISKYKAHLDSLALPSEPYMTVEMPITIKKDTNYGEAIIPCTFYTAGFGVDLNPSLVKRKTKVKIKDFKVGETITVKPDEEIILDNDMQQIDVLEACNKCGKKIVVSEIKEVQWRSCPKICITLSHNVPEDVIIPARFGITKEDYNSFIAGKGSQIAIFVISVAVGIALHWIYTGSDLFTKSVGLLVLIMGANLLIEQIYTDNRTKKWWNSVKDSARPALRGQNSVAFKA